MANTVTPFGFRPIRRLDGEAWSENLTQRKIANNGGGALNPWRVTPPPVKSQNGPAADRRYLLHTTKSA
jgi:hypothetical protein